MINDTASKIVGQVEELMLDLTKQVYKNEPDVLRYRLNYQEDTGEFVVIERSFIVLVFRLEGCLR